MGKKKNNKKPVVIITGYLGSGKTTLMHMLLGLSIAFVLFLIILMNSTIRSSAQSEDFEPQIKYYKTVMVHSGDTMWSIADSYYSLNVSCIKKIYSNQLFYFIPKRLIKKIYPPISF